MGCGTSVNSASSPNQGSFGDFCWEGQKAPGYAWGGNVFETKGFYCVHQPTKGRYVGIKIQEGDGATPAKQYKLLLKMWSSRKVVEGARNILPLCAIPLCGVVQGDAHDLFSGLAFLHQLKIIHRDVKLENILVSNKDPCKAWLCLSNFAFSVTTTDGVLEYRAIGTPSYIAPEIVNNEGYDTQADVWSAGVCIYKMITGSYPWHKKMGNEKMREIKEGNWDRENLTKNGYGNLIGFISSMLCLDPRKRVRAANAMQHARSLAQQGGEENPDMSFDDIILPQGETDSKFVQKVESGTGFPSYWLNGKGSRKDKEFRTRREFCVPAFQDQLKLLLTETFKNKKTRDRKGDLPKGFKLIEAHRVEDSFLWGRYAAAREKLRLHRGIVEPFCDLDGDGDVDTGGLKTEKALGDFSSHLDASINECYLFHGTSPEAAHSITETGFNLEKAGSNVGTMFGAGCYFAEASSKADEYSQRGAGMYSASFAMLVCRVVCGQMFRMTKSDVPALDCALATGKYDAVLGDREASVGTYREFVVFDSDLIYPEYLILYEHE